MNKIITTSIRLKDYAIWYYLRYYPSNKKLEQKLLEKTESNRELVESVLPEIKHLFSEDDIIRSKIKNFIFRNKNINYIKLNLRQKLFDTERVNHILINEFQIEEQSLLQEHSLLKKVENYKNKGKSMSYIKTKLIERTLDKQGVEEAIHTIF